jgi:molybdopterin synthase sulfur carrier subunit
MKVLFFASVRESLGVAEEFIAEADAPADLEDLRAGLARRGDEWRAALYQPNLLCAVNQAVVHGNVSLAATDEVAFYPPVTGG